MKRRYKVVFSSDDHTSDCEVYLTPHARDLLLEVAAAVNANAKWSVDIRMNIEPAPTAPQGDAA